MFENNFMYNLITLINKYEKGIILINREPIFQSIIKLVKDNESNIRLLKIRIRSKSDYPFPAIFDKEKNTFYISEKEFKRSGSKKIGLTNDFFNNCFKKHKLQLDLCEVNPDSSITYINDKVFKKIYWDFFANNYLNITNLRDSIFKETIDDIKL